MVAMPRSVNKKAKHFPETSKTQGGWAKINDFPFRG
tara:strand:+ start:743 stop:850 length:108 start_codon:yes stop_codon:yes gene_type:complete